MGKKDLSFPYFDVWSLGIIAYQMMSGELPYEVTTALMVKEIETKERPHVKKYSHRLNSLVDMMLTIKVS